MSISLHHTADPDGDDLWRRLWDADAVQPPYYQPGELLAAARHFQPVYYLPGHLRYEQSGDLPVDLAPERLVAVEDGRPVAGLALTVERHRGGTRISCYGRPLYLVRDSTAGEDRVAAAAGLLHGRLDELVRRHGAPGYHLRDFLAHGRLSPLSERVLRDGGQAVPYFTQVIDLRQSPEAIRAGLRDNHRRILRKRTPQLRMRVVGPDTVRPDHADLMVRLHRIMRGSTVRSEAYWRAVVESVRLGEGFLVVAEDAEREVAVAHFATSTRMCFYSTAAHDPAHKGAGLSHVLLWRAIEHAKELGCAGFEVGDRIYPGQHSFVPEKLHGISHFKAGFGSAATVRMDVLSAAAEPDPPMDGGHRTDD
ncbi:GNAT family N-acetyltransferase [Actinosynnema sp. CS-041913]|uniref:GNAT family N-acetyltransferase n=1 Tax=Actinosynnema sp. CS-041913 TaxID=3239917 RepID=UPI003D91F9CA